MISLRKRTAGAVTLLLALAGCSPEPPNHRPLASPTPIITEDVASPQTISSWTKVEPRGRTVCARGRRYAFWVHRDSPDNLLIFFQAGGGCFDAGTCASGSSFFDDSVTESDNPAVAEHGVLAVDDPGNPFWNYSMVYVPSCTGDVHWGDNVQTYEGEGRETVTVQHRGFVNASAAVEWAYRHVVDPRSVFVTGCSAGSVGSAAFAPYIVERYPDARIAQLGDSLAFVFHRPINLEEDYGAHDNFPQWIPALKRIKPGEFTMARYYAVVAQHYPGVVFSQFNYSGDRVQRSFYEAVGGKGIDFRPALKRSLREIERAAPNFRSYTARGTEHCILPLRKFFSHATDGVPLREWVADLAAGKHVLNVRPR